MEVVPAVPAQEVGEPETLMEAVPACDVEPVATGNEPRPAVPRPVVPRPATPRPVTPRPAVSNVELVVIEFPELDDGSDEEELAFGAAVAVGLPELITPELLTELQRAGMPVAPEATERPEVVKLVEELMPPPSKLGNTAGPALPVKQAAGPTVPK